MFNRKRIARLEEKIEEQQALIDSLLLSIISVKNEDLSNLKALLTQPLLEKKWAKQKQEDGQKIVNKGIQVIEKRNALHNEILKLEREGRNVDLAKEQLKAYDEIIEMIRG